ncbi:hypothetical protein E2C01_003555 [Portunus trituberculatus]|uniref:Uncharacterized protein n=1 Tax=Portunus trituberculatus TaxID=210409 RepID=A0A5B7CMH6_PORTR|nr:hypothetical protein [Portunus trituberculatus]
MQKNVVYLKTAVGLMMHTTIRYTILLVIRHQNGTVATARREMTELCIRPNVWPFNYQIFSQLISLWF